MWLAAVQAPVYLYHTHSYDVQLHRLMGRSFPPCRHVVIEHGTVEWFRYIEGCKRGVVDPNIHYLLSFHEEIVRYLARNGIEPTLSSSPFPFRTTPRNGAAPDCQGRTLFAIQPLVDDGVIDETDCRQVMARFLARRPEKHYVVKSHPRCCERTVQIVSQALRQAGCVHELLSASDGIIETQFPKYRCEEICSFYSTATMLTAKLHDVPFDTAIPELLEYATIRMPVQRELIALIAELFQLIP
ncbi:MAG: hypothetical protein JNM56_40340 [Planctomycetia bacterium]|nr:hypothetical protein [Planctomycetia bacterium]